MTKIPNLVFCWVICERSFDFQNEFFSVLFVYLWDIRAFECFTVSLQLNEPMNSCSLIGNLWPRLTAGSSCWQLDCLMENPWDLQWSLTRFIVFPTDDDNNTESRKTQTQQNPADGVFLDREWKQKKNVNSVYKRKSPKRSTAAEKRTQVCFQVYLSPTDTCTWNPNWKNELCPDYRS